MTVEEIILRGLPVSKGIGIGIPIFFSSWDQEVPVVQISSKEIDREIDRYRIALSKSREDLERLSKDSTHEGSSEIVAILGAHLELIKDPMITSVIEEKIRLLECNTESVFVHFIDEYKKRFSGLKDSYFQERVRDIIDVSRRILSHLCPLKRMKITEIPNNSVILTHELVPSETVEVSASLVSGFVTAAGGITSHAAIIARAKGIPYVANVEIKLFNKSNMHSLIVDGGAGLVIVNPTEQTLEKYQALKRESLENEKQLQNSTHLKAETIDAYEVKVFANLENPEEVDLSLKYGALGIGLFRSEYLFLAKKGFPSENEQFEIYKKMALGLKDKPLVVRVFDVGGDKKGELTAEHLDHHYFANIGHELNPSLGCRAIRFLLRFPQLLEAQLRAILRASAFGEIQILIPMVSDLSELRSVRAMIQVISEDLTQKNIPHSLKIAVGCMIEVPSSAIMCDALAQEADFLSIGTNDLIQYVLAADRTNPNTNQLYFSTHPSILRLIRMVVAAANDVRKPVIVCGECAADPTLIPILLGLGIREFSVAVHHIPTVKHTIRKWRILESCALAERALEYTVAQELKDFLVQETTIP